MHIVLKWGSIDKPLKVFWSIYYNSFFILLCSTNTYACKGVFNPNIPMFPPNSNSAEGLHFSAFHIFSIHYNDLLKEVEQTGLGIQLSSGKTVGGMLFADDFVRISDSKESLQKLIDVVYSYCSKWRLRANVS